MLIIKDIEKYINDDILDTLFKAREDELFSKKERIENAEIRRIKEEYPVNYDKILTEISKIPQHVNGSKKKIIETLEKYITRENLIAAYENEKFYKIGFCDGIRTILENVIHIYKE